MEFGKVDARTLEQIDFRLPPEPAVNRQALQRGRGDTRFYIGCARWSWAARLPGTRGQDSLSRYAKLFNCVELNTTFYQTPDPAQVAAWKQKAGPGFRFCPKFPELITHEKCLQDAGMDTHAFLSSVQGFGDSLGPIFLMPHPRMDLQARGIIERFIAGLPPAVPLFLELRHPDWFREGYDPALYRFLAAQGRGAVITDAAGRRDCVHMHLSVPEAFIRFVGNGLHPTDYTRIDEWVQRIRLWMEAGLESLYFFVHQHDELHTPELIRYLIRELNRHCGTHIPVPEPGGAPTLF